MMQFVSNLKARWDVRISGIKGKVLGSDFTIVSNNCWGAEVYRELGIPYKTPFVGMFIFAPDYIELLKNLKEISTRELEFTSHSKYFKEENQPNYPIGLIGGKVEVHFLHYASPSIAKEKWDRRVARINWNNLFIEFSDRDKFSKQILEDFDKLKYPKKVCFTSKKYPQSTSSVQISDCKNQPTVMDGKLLYIYCKKYFDLASWLNS